MWFLAKERKLSSNWDLEVSVSLWLVCLLALRGCKPVHRSLQSLLIRLTTLVLAQKAHMWLELALFVKPAFFVFLVCVCSFSIFGETHIFSLVSGFTVTDTYSQQTPFPTVQQLQDSSTLESQALSTSFHQQNLLPVPGTDTINVVSVTEVSSWADSSLFFTVIF